MQRVKSTIRQAIASVRKDKGHSVIYELLFVSSQEVARAKTHGLDIADYWHAIDGSAIQHIFKKHAGVKMEQARGQIAIVEADLESIPEILSNPDHVIYGLQNNRGAKVLGYIKTMPDGVLVYLETVRTKKSTLATQTMWKHPRGTAAASIEKALRLTSGTAQGIVGV